MNSLKAKFGPEVKILHAVDAYDNARVLVIGDPDNGVYEWAIERNGKVEEHSDLAYGNTMGALRDGLIAYWPPMDDRSTPSATVPSINERRYEWFKANSRQAAMMGERPFWTTNFTLDGNLSFDEAIDKAMATADGKANK